MDIRIDFKIPPEMEGKESRLKQAPVTVEYTWNANWPPSDTYPEAPPAKGLSWKTLTFEQQAHITKHQPSSWTREDLYKDLREKFKMSDEDANKVLDAAGR